MACRVVEGGAERWYASTLELGLAHTLPAVCMNLIRFDLGAVYVWASVSGECISEQLSCLWSEKRRGRTGPIVPTRDAPIHSSRLTDFITVCVQFFGCLQLVAFIHLCTWTISLLHTSSIFFFFTSRNRSSTSLNRSSILDKSHIVQLTHQKIQFRHVTQFSYVTRGANRVDNVPKRPAVVEWRRRSVPRAGPCAPGFVRSAPRRMAMRSLLLVVVSAAAIAGHPLCYTNDR